MKRSAVLVSLLVVSTLIAPAASASSQVTRLTASDARDHDRFGGALSLDGARVAVGAGSGVYIFEEVNGAWTETTKIPSSAEVSFVDLKGDDLLFRNSGGSDLWVWENASWIRQAQFRPSSTWGSHAAAISGDWVAMQGLANPGAPRVYTYERTAGIWSQKDVLQASGATLGVFFGDAIAISGTHLLVGDERDAETAVRGAIYAYEWDGATWTELAKMHPSDGGREFGRHIDIDDVTAIVSSEETGYILEFDGAQWSETQILSISDQPDPNNFVIWDVAIDGDVALVGAQNDRDSIVYVFENGPGGWQEVDILQPDEGSEGDWFGAATDVSGNLMVGGALGVDAAALDAGAAYVFNLLPSCNGFDATISGTSGNDVVNGTQGADVIDAGAGDDIINGLGGDDIICGGAGNDSIEGGPGEDHVIGGGGDDSIDGGADSDELHGGPGNDILLGGGANDQLLGDSGDDELLGGSGDDGLDGGAGIDAASYAGASGPINANLESGLATGQGSDTFSLIESLIGSEGADTLRGDDSNNTIAGRKGADVIKGLAGEDELFGGPGKDKLQGGSGRDLLNGGSGSDRLLGGSGADDLYGNSGNDIMIGGTGRENFMDGGSGSDTVDYRDEPRWIDIDLDDQRAWTKAGDERLWRIENVRGTTFDDEIRGNAASNNLRGYGGDDVLSGRGGNDVLEAGDGIDLLELVDEPTGTEVDLMAELAGDDTVSGFEKVVGSEFDDVIKGDSKPNTLKGGGGDDLIDGRAGFDTLKGGSGDDELLGRGGNDVIEGQSGRDLLWGGGGDDVLSGGTGGDGVVPGSGSDVASGGSGIDFVSYFDSSSGVDVDLMAGTAFDGAPDTLSGFEWLEGSEHDDLLRGNERNNLVFGLRGDDTLVGLEGRDTLVGGPGRDLLKGGPGFDAVSYFDVPGGVDVHLATGTASGDGRDSLASIEDIVGSPGVDMLTGNGGENLIEGRDSNDTIRGGSAGDFLFGMDGNDSIFGEDGNDGLDGGSGSDALNGGGGSDICINGETHTSCEQTNSLGPQGARVDGPVPWLIARRPSSDASTILADETVVFLWLRWRALMLHR